jgi:hypothetical protein
MKFRVFWDVAPHSHVDVERCFRGAYWRQNAPLKRRSTSLHLCYCTIPRKNSSFLNFWSYSYAVGLYFVTAQHISYINQCVQSH